MASIRVSIVAGLLFFVGATAAFAQKGPDGDHHVVSPPDQTERAGSVNFLGNREAINVYAPGLLDESVWALQSHIKAVRQQWIESIADDNDQKNSIHDSGVAFAEALVGIPNNVLGLGALIVRDEYACFGLIIAAANSTSSQTQMTLGKRAETLCESAAAYLRVAIEQASTDGSARAVMEWSRSSDEQPRIAYLLAMSSCLQSTNATNDFRQQAALRAMRSIPEYYLTRYPPVGDEVLKRCIAP
jgi:hypothetical protein